MERQFGVALVLGVDPLEPAPGATVTVYDAGTLNLATIFADNVATPKANPYTADATTGLWFHYAANGRYDIKFSGGGIATPYTLSDVLLLDSVSGGFLSTLNGLTNATQTLATGTAGADFNIVSAGTTHTFNIPSAGAAARGLVSTGAQTIAGAKTFSTPIAAGSGGTGLDGSAAGNGFLLIGNGTGYTLAAPIAGNSISLTLGAGSLTINTIQDIRTSAQPTFSKLTLSGLNPLILTNGLPHASGFTLAGDPTTGEMQTAGLGDGNILIGQTGSVPIGAPLTAGAGITVTNGPGSITIANSGVLDLSGQTGSIALAIGAAGTDLAWNIGATTTLNVPDASSTARGVINTGAQTLAGRKTFNIHPLVRPGSVAESVTAGRVVVGFLFNGTAAQNTGAGEDDLQSVTLPADSLDTNDSSRLRIQAWGTFAANANAKITRLYFGATELTELNGSVNDGPWYIEALVVRTGAGNQSVICRGFSKASAASAAAFSLTTMTVTTPAETLTAAVTIKTTGEGVANADIISSGLSVEVLS